MKMQLGPLVALAVLYTSVTAVPVPDSATATEAATEAAVPPVGDAVFDTFGKVLATLFAAVVPHAALTGALGAVDACYKDGSGSVVCPRDEPANDAGTPDQAFKIAGNIGAVVVKLYPPYPMKDKAKDSKRHAERDTGM
ncbi:hypothetical protein CPB84DRAFT_1751028 [Gymnopilus junonius]|uniref:Uncharacterized protein n=1 Tax=Gymnopilus junonius TaxID=109634 RepID=A0A9P5TJA3_GYMJU|nr:hypothetical protein CPB84DRAFT_1751028 [Gymnopilus junonius]